MKRDFSRAGLAFCLIISLAACATQAEIDPPVSTVSAATETPTADPLKFDMANARAAMNALAFDNPARIDPIWMASGDTFVYLYGSDVRVRDTVTGAMILDLSASELAQELAVSEDDLNIAIDTDATHLRLTVGERHWRRALTQDAQPEPAAPAPEARVVRKMFPMNGYDRRENRSPDGTLFASLEGPNLAIRGADEDTARLLTQEQEPFVQWFHGNDIWENSGTIWNAQGTHFIARQHDARDTPGLLSLDYLSKSEALTDFRYWARAGDPLPITTLFAVDASTGALRQLGDPSGPDEHLLFIEWSPDGKSILAIRYARDLSTQTILSIEIATGTARTLSERSADHGWVKWPSGPRTIRHLETGEYLLRTDDSGYFHYVILDASGDPVRALTDGEFDVGDVIGIDESQGWLYYLAPVSEARPYDQIPHRVQLTGGAPQILAEQTGIYSAYLSPSKSHLVWVHSDTDRASSAELATADGTGVTVLESADTPTTLLGSPLPETTVFESFNGSKVYATILKPANFDPTASYPVIHRVYGAMQSKVRRSGFWSEGVGWPGSEYSAMLNYLAQQGFVVVMMDPPGTPGRGRAYNLAPWGDWPGDTAQHYVTGLKKLAETRPWMDLNRVGIDGNSWGGYVALYTALEQPEMYRATAISVPEVDLVDHAHWIEWQLGTPTDNPDAYAAGALQNRIAELSSDLLIVAGTSDANVPVSNTMKLLDALAENGKAYDLALFPGTNHPHQGRGDRYAYAVERIRVFFTEKLMHETESQ